MNIYIWEDGYFQIDTQTGEVGLSDTPIIEGWTGWTDWRYYD